VKVHAAHYTWHIITVSGRSTDRYGAIRGGCVVETSKTTSSAHQDLIQTSKALFMIRQSEDGMRGIDPNLESPIKSL